MHPSVADQVDTTQIVDPSNSPLFSPKDATWNHGEGFIRDYQGYITGSDGGPPMPGAPAGLTPTTAALPADTGGYFFFDDGRQLIPGDIHMQWDWHDHTLVGTPEEPVGATTVRRFVGFLYPPEAGSVADGHAARNAFEIFVPTEFTGNRTVLVLGAWYTFGGASAPSQKFLSKV